MLSNTQRGKKVADNHRIWNNSGIILPLSEKEILALKLNFDSRKHTSRMNIFLHTHCVI